jgi:hypothetical protein
VLGIPDGWTYFHAPPQGTRATITIPGIEGVAHVLTHISAKMYNVTNVGAFGITLSAHDGAIAIWQSLLVVTGAGANIITMDSLDPDLNLACAPGNALVVSFDSVSASLWQALLINGYDT